MTPEYDLPLKDRAYIMRIRREGADVDEFIPVVTFTITTYKCGLRVGDKLQLLKDTGEFKAGGIFTVLTGAEEEPCCLWMLDPDRKTSAWEDEFSIYDLFEKQGNT